MMERRAHGRLHPPLQGEVERATFAANRARGSISLAVAATPSATRRTRTREDGSLRVRFPNACAGAPEAVLVNTAGGLTGGDRFAIDLALLARTIAIALAPSAKLVLAETIVFGRSAMGETVHEGSFADRWRVRRDGRLIFAENFRLDGPVTDRLNEAAVAGGCTAIGTVLMAPGDDVAVAAVRSACGQFRGEVGISAWNGIALARLAARDGAALRHDLVVLLSALGRRALPRIWLN